ncbi:twin-arginine translocation pathway signal protein [Epibacterium sp. SM1979]|uniref:Twin-arginine translocation pathway signal protein n=1 Tax=Tritonibacter litoralis TaxID=2662264 RepID=A0A843YMN3_9RHOB|nr:DM13 domain-containing protein [Tritonibacter litoralis]MQQ10453.1 twin-arginine translocation pathway signal protein [Tritonibacter litoralis]
MKSVFVKSLGIAAAAMIAFAPLAATAGQSKTHGEFTGASDHVTTGGVKIIKTKDGGAVVILDSDFSLDGAPDPRVGFGKDGEFVDTADLGALQSKTGTQVYIVPASVNVNDFNEVYIWCKKFSVPLGVAALK